MTSNGISVLSLTDVEEVLPTEYEIVPPTDPRNDNRNALRAVRHNATAQTHYFYSAQEYLKFAASVIPCHRLLAEEYGTRYIQLSACYDHDPYFHASVIHTIAAFTRRNVVIHRLKSDETAVCMEFSTEEMKALIERYQPYMQDCEDGTANPEFDPFLAVPDEIA
jgi:hypothetical protein